jgi:hypothetical protein
VWYIVTKTDGCIDWSALFDQIANALGIPRGNLLFDEYVFVTSYSCCLHSQIATPARNGAKRRWCYTWKAILTAARVLPSLVNFFSLTSCSSQGSGLPAHGRRGWCEIRVCVIEYALRVLFIVMTLTNRNSEKR